MNVRDRWAGLREIAVFVAAYLTYFGVRALTEGAVPQAHHNAGAVVDLERELGMAVEGQVQRAVLPHPVLVDAANAVYMYGHWPVIITGGVLLFRYRRQDYYRLRNAFLITGLVGLVVFAVFPVAPPRLTDLPLVDTVTSEAEGYRQILPASFVNEYAAMPSFHVGWNLLLGIVVYRAVRHWWLRGLAVVGPASMAVAVVVTANHYILDVVAGAAIVLLALALLVHAERRHTARRRPPAADAPHTIPPSLRLNTERQCGARPMGTPSRHESLLLVETTSRTEREQQR